MFARSLTLALAFAAASCAAAEDRSPLLAYAAEQAFPPLLDRGALRKNLARVTSAISKDPPPDADCAQTLGARRFAAMFDELGAAYSSLGDAASAADAFTKAVSCNPRAAFLHAQLGTELLHLGRYEEARGQSRPQPVSGPANFVLDALLAQVDFIEEQWPEAIAQLRVVVQEAPDDEQATYWQCLLWLAQSRAGTASPVLASRRATDKWPLPILESLQGKLGEADLVELIKAEHEARRRHEILSEALFYSGQRQLAAHRMDEARRYFAATVNLDVQYFIEHHLAVAELAKLGNPR